MTEEAVMKEMRQLREEFSKRLGDMRTELDKVVETGKKVVEERPLLALGVAFAFGVVIGVILDRSASRD